MKIIYFVLAIIQLVSCSSQETETESKLSGLKKYFYSRLGEIEQVEVINTAFRDEQMVSYYIELIEREYDLNGNIIRQTTYNIEENDTIFHDFIGKIFDKKNRLIRKTDSMKMLNIVEEFQYKNDDLYISSNKFVYSNGVDIDDKLTWTPIDSTLTINHHFYEDGQCSYLLTFNLRADQMGVNDYLPDSVFTYNKYDLNNNKIESVAINGIDTLYKIYRKFDSKNREIEFTRVINGSTIDSIHRKFDDRNNKIFEQSNSENSSQRIELEYNERNQLVKEKWYQLE